MSAVSQSTNHWTAQPIESVAAVEFGTRVTKRVDAGTRYPVYGGGGATFSMNEYNREDCYIVSRFGMSEECVRRVDGKFFLNDSGLSVRTRDKELLDQRFLDTYLLGSQAKIFGLGRGAAQKNLNVEAFRQLMVPLPPLDEQKRIVAKLDQAFAALDRARANAEANLADVATLVSSELESIFKLDSLPSDQVHAIADVFFTVTGNTPSKAEAVFYGADIPFVKPPELMGGVVGNTGDNLSELGGASARLAPKGTVLVSCIGNLGKIGLLDRKSAFNQQINAILPIERAIPEFVMYQCRSPQFMKQLERRAGGTTVSIVNKSQFNELNFWLPEVNVQATIVSKFKRLEETAGALNGRCSAKLTDIVALRQSLLQAAFSGQLS